MLPRWLGYYGEQVGVENLVILDDQSDDGSTADIGATVIRLPRRAASTAETFDTAKMRLSNGLASTLLAVYDVVVFVDVDEFIIPDPRHYSGLRDYLTHGPSADVIAPIGLNLVHSPRSAPALDPDLPLLQQRRHVRFAPYMCKPAIKRKPFAWGRGQHGIKAEYAIHRDVFLLHSHYADLDLAVETQRARFEEFRTWGSGERSIWSRPPESLPAHLEEWTVDEGDPDPPLFDPQTIAIEGVVQQREKRGGYTSRTGPNREQPLMTVPDYLDTQV